MARLQFSFRTTGTVKVSFDPEEFRGLHPMDIAEAIRAELPPNVNQEDVVEAADELHAALKAARD